MVKPVQSEIEGLLHVGILFDHSRIVMIRLGVEKHAKRGQIHISI